MASPRRCAAAKNGPTSGRVARLIDRAGASVGPNIFAIDKFVEKPDAKTAEHYVSEGYLWNSGNFVFRAGLLLDEYKRFETDSLATVVESVERAGSDLGFITLDASSFARAAAKAIDYAVMERTKNAAVTRAGFRIVEAPEAQRVHDCHWPRAHGEDVAQDAAHARGSALERLDEAGVVVRFDLEGDDVAAAHIDDAGVFAGSLHDQLAARGQLFQVKARTLVGAVLAPHHAEDAELGVGGLASQQ